MSPPRKRCITYTRQSSSKSNTALMQLAPSSITIKRDSEGAKYATSLITSTSSSLRAGQPNVPVSIKLDRNWRRSSSKPGSGPLKLMPQAMSTRQISPADLLMTDSMAHETTHSERMLEHVFRLSEVHGCSTVTSRSLSVDEVTGQTAYIAGSTVVITKGRQAHLVSTSKNSLTCLAFSPCGRYLATGEAGNSPKVRVWHVCDDEGRFVGKQMLALGGHQFGIVDLAFMDSGVPRLISAGNQHDGQLFIWDWRSGRQITSNKAAHVYRICVSPGGTSFTTVGHRHLKMWTFTKEDERLHGRTAILGSKRTCVFTDAIYVDDNRVLAIADSCSIVELSDKKISHTYSLGQRKIYALALLGHQVVVGGENGELFACNMDDLRQERSFPVPHHLLFDPAEATHQSALNPQNHPPGSVYPDVRSLAVHPSSQTVSVLYSDRSVYLWKIVDNEIHKVYSEFGHVGAILAADIYPSHHSFLPPGTFVTGGVDGTVRLWNHDKTVSEQIIQTSLVPSSNVYSRSLKKIVYSLMDPSLVTEKPEDTKIVASDELDNNVAVKSLKFSPDGRQLAIGMKNGTFWILDVSQMSVAVSIDAHDSDILVVEYNDPAKGGPALFASGGRDRIVHVFSPQQDYSLVGTFLDHQSGVIGIKFAQTHSAFRMFTLGTDKIIVIWVYNKDLEHKFQRVNTITCSHNFTDMVISPEVNSLVVGCGDRQLRVYSLSGKLQSTLAGSSQRPGTQCPFGRICIDPSGTLAACISDKVVHVIELRGQRVLAVLPGCGEMPSHVAFSADLKYLLVCSINGCIYTWRLSSKLSTRIQMASRELYERLERVPTPDSVLGSGSDCVSEEHPTPLSVTRTENFSSGGSSFGSVDSIHLDVPTGAAFSVDAPDRNVEVERRTESVVRRSTSNLHYGEEGDQEEEENRNDERPTRQYTTSKSMSNLRVMEPRVPSAPRSPRKKWGDNSGMQEDINHANLLQGLLDTSGRSRGENDDNYLQPQHNNGNHMAPGSMNSAYAGTSLQRQLDLQNGDVGPPRYSSTPLQSRNGINSPFSRSAAGRVSLTKSFLNKSGQLAKEDVQAATLWSPQQLSSSRRTISNMSFVGGGSNPNGPVASAINRRQTTSLAAGSSPGGRPVLAHRAGASTEKIRRARTFGRLKDLPEATSRPKNAADDYSSSNLHLRSRSQSPNHLIQNGHLSHLATPSKRRDSDMSFTGLSSRLTSSRSNLAVQNEGVRKSNTALDKMAQMRSKLRQSTENIMGGDDEEMTSSAVSRSRSIGNLRNGGTQLQAYDTFDADAPSNNTHSSLAHSRMLARSMGNVSAQEDGSIASPSAKLAHTINAMKKASNPDLTDAALFDENTSMQDRLINRRGAVQKRVERYHPRNRTTRTGTSEESDSNASEQSPQQGARRYFGSSGTRSISSVESRPAGLSSPMRRFDTPRHNSSQNNGISSRRGNNYLTQKLEAGSDVGPDLGSDESARSSTVPSMEFLAKFQNMSLSDQNMARHLETATEELLTSLEKVLCASKLVRESEFSSDSRRLLNEKILGVFRTVGSKIDTEFDKFGERRTTEDSLHDTVYHATKVPRFSTQPGGSPMDVQAFFAEYGQNLMELMKQNMPKGN